MGRTASRPLTAAALAAVLGGCAHGGFIGPQPLVTNPGQASTVTFYRTKGVVGFVGPIVVELDGQPLMRLWGGQSFSFQIDPGEYLIDYSIGFNDCRRALIVYPGHSYSYRLVPNCTVWETWR
jgi:hypothetical protein